MVVRSVLRLRNRSDEGLRGREGKGCYFNYGGRRRIWRGKRGKGGKDDHFVASVQVVTRNLFLFICPGCLSVSPAAGRGGTGTGTGLIMSGKKQKEGYDARVCRTWMDGCLRSCRPLPTHLCLFGNRRRRNATDRPTVKPIEEQFLHSANQPNAECLCSGIFAASLRRRATRGAGAGGGHCNAERCANCTTAEAAAVECN